MHPKKNFKSVDNLPKVDETNEEHIAPANSKKKRFKIRGKLNFSDKIEDKLDGHLSHVSDLRKRERFADLLSNKFSEVWPIEEVRDYRVTPGTGARK